MISSSGMIRSASRSTRKSLPGRRRPLAATFSSVGAEDARLGGQHHPAVAGHEPPARPQAVAVQGGAHHAPVAEGHRGGAVPRLHESRVVGEEVAHLLRLLGPPVGLRHQHRDGVGGRAPAQHEQLEQAVERGGVRDVVPQERPDLVHVVAEQLRGQVALAGAHPVAVPAQGVDLAVVGEHPVGVGQLPARERVGGEARVHHGQAALVERVAQVGEVERELRGGEHPLVDDGPRGEARDREAVEPRVLDHPPDHVELALERVAVGHALAGAHEELDHVGRGGARGRAGRALVHGHVAPAEHALALALHRGLDHGHRPLARAGLAREEAHGHPVAARVRAASKPRLLPQEGVGKLGEDARAVPGVRVRALRAPVLELLERVQGPRDHLVRAGSAHACDKRDAAGVVLVARVVQAWSCCLQGDCLL